MGGGMLSLLQFGCEGWVGWHYDDFFFLGGLVFFCRAGQMFCSSLLSPRSTREGRDGRSGGNSTALIGLFFFLGYYSWNGRCMFSFLSLPLLDYISSALLLVISFTNDYLACTTFPLVLYLFIRWIPAQCCPCLRVACQACMMNCAWSHLTMHRLAISVFCRCRMQMSNLTCRYASIRARNT